jgi:hypothetical protein
VHGPAWIAHPFAGKLADVDQSFYTIRDARERPYRMTRVIVASTV